MVNAKFISNFLLFRLFGDEIIWYTKEICQLQSQCKFKLLLWLGAAGHKKESWNRGADYRPQRGYRLCCILVSVFPYYRHLLSSPTTVWLCISKNKMIDFNFFFWNFFSAWSGNFLDNHIMHHQKKADQWLNVCVHFPAHGKKGQNLIPIPSCLQ